VLKQLNLSIVSEVYSKNGINELISMCFCFLVGLYQWGDKSLKKFDSTNPWWCRRNIVHLGYYHQHNEPTRQIRNNDSEKCVLFRRGISSVQMLCLDDVLCGEEYPFICERCM
jgi:hypothetical protein